MRLLFLSLLSLSCWAQYVVTPSTVTFRMQEEGPVDFSVPITLTGSGAWTATVGGDPFTLSATSGSASATVYLKPAYAFDNSAVGTHNYNTNVVIAGQTMTISMIISRRMARPLYSNIGGIADGSLATCSNPDSALWWSRARCTTSLKPGGAFTLPAVGSTYVDGVFGSTVTRVSGCYHQYAGLSQISSDNVFILSEVPNAACTAGVYYRSGAGKFADHPRVTNSNFSQCSWFPQSSRKVVCYTAWVAQSIWTATLSGGGTWTDNGVLWAEPHGLTMDTNYNIGNGGQSPPSGDGWVPIITCSKQYIYAVNINSGAYKTLDLSTTAVPFAGGTTASTECGGAGNNPDHLQISSKTQNGKWYIIAVPDNNQETYKALRLYSFTETTEIVFERLWAPGFELDGAGTSNKDKSCTTANTTVLYQCLPIWGTHGLFMMVNGEAYLDIPSERVGKGYISYMTLFRASAGNDASTAATLLGGGLHWMNPGTTSHTAAARLKPYVVGNGVSFPTDYTITAATGSSPVTLTLSPDPSWMTGQAVIIGCINPVKTGLSYTTGTVTSIGGAQYTYNVASSGTYTANACRIAANTAITNDVVELDVVRLGDLGPIQVLRLAHSNGVQYGAAYNSYPFPDISPDGSTVIWLANGGYPGALAETYAADTGWTADRDNEMTLAGKTVRFDPGTTTALVTVKPPTTATVDIAVSDRPDFTTTTASASLAGTNTSDRTATLTGLSAGTCYYWRAQSTAAKYVALSQFCTQASFSGSAVASFSAVAPTGTTTIGLSYGTTSSLGSFTSTACTAGQRCTIQLSATRGTQLWAAVDFRNGGGTTLQTLETTARLVQ